ncbi:MAG: SusC/RagA family TonB-linked outer membrane protein [Marinifilaceae bacterium]
MTIIPTFAQRIRVKGVVSDVAGRLIQGATVMKKDSGLSTLTNEMGEYTLLVNKGECLLFLSVGMKKCEAIIEDSILNISLISEPLLMDEVIVTALDIKHPNRSLGYSATTFNKGQLERNRSNEIMTSLQGKVAGVQISSTSTDPGASSSVIIRGFSSLNGNNQPLYILDGVPLSNNAKLSGDALNNGFDFGSGINLINPDNIETITVLKGAAATALYGSRAANGVVLLSSKQDKEGRGMSISLSSTVQISSVLRLPEFQNSFGQGYYGAEDVNENTSWGPEFDNRWHEWGNIYNGIRKSKRYVSQKDNVRRFFDTGVMTSNSITATGGNETTNFRAGYNNVTDNGIMPGKADRYVRNVFSISGSHIFGRLALSANVNIGEQKNSFAATGQGMTVVSSLYQIPRDIDITGLKDYVNDPYNTPEYYFSPYGVTNPYWILDNTTNNFKQQKIFGKVQADICITRNLEGVYRLGYDATDNETKLATPKLELMEGTPNADQIWMPGSVSKGMERSREVNHEFMLTYNKRINGFKTTILAGANMNEMKYSSVFNKVTGLEIPGFEHITNSASAAKVNERSSLRRLFGLFGQAEFSFNELLFLTVTARNDWSSTLPKGKRDYFYPGATGAFVFSELLSEQARNVLSYAKLRVAYGRTGNDADPYMLTPYYVQGYGSNLFGNITFPLSGINSYTYGNRLGNAGLSPEISDEIEAGGCVTFWKGFLSVDVAFYKRTSDKQIFNIGVDPSTGFSSQVTNLGKISNQGVELLVNVVPVKYKGGSWEVSVNYTKNKNRVESLPAEFGNEVNLYDLGMSTSATHLVARVGQPIGEYRVTMPKRAPDGSIIVNGNNGMPVANPELQYYHDMNSKYELGVINNLSLGGWNLNFCFDVRNGGYMYSRTAYITQFAGSAIQTVYNDRRPFVVPHSVNAITDENGNVHYVENTTPVSTDMMKEYIDLGGESMEAAKLVPRGFVKLRNISLSYQLPSRLTEKMHINGMKLTLYGNNLFLWTPRANSYIDPEISSFGNDLIGRMGEFCANPTRRNMGINLQLTF